MTLALGQRIPSANRLQAVTLAPALAKAELKTILRDPCLFSLCGGGLRMRDYQQEPARAILRSIREHAGRSIVILFPRQSGKNELQAQLEAYLLLLLSQHESEIVKVSPTWKPQSLNAMRRLERVLDGNRFTRGRWEKESGYIYRLGKARVFFLSGQPTANIVGATASTLLSVDEAQEISIEKFDKEIAPMAASTNATRVFWGTAWTASTLLARELRAAEAAQLHDGIQRVFRIDADTVAREVPEYGAFVQQQVERLGREHPLIKTQFFSEELAGEGGLFPPERIRQMQGDHTSHYRAEPGRQYAFLIDFAGCDAAGTYGSGQSVADANSGLVSVSKTEPGRGRPERDATALTIVEVDTSTRADALYRAPIYRCVRRYEWRGTPSSTLLSAIHTLAERWQPRYLVTDATGLGAPLTSFLQQTYGERVIPFVFTSRSKSRLGWDFLTVVDSGRWQEFALSEEPTQLDYQAEFYRQMRFTAFRVETGLLRWGVPDGTRDADTGDILHDDWLMSAAMCVCLEDKGFAEALPSEGNIIAGVDPLDEMDAEF